MSASFDGTQFASGSAAMRAGSVNTFSGQSTSGDKTLSLTGSFFNNGALAKNVAPAAVGGIFAVRGNAYGANGIFAGQKTP